MCTRSIYAAISVDFTKSKNYINKNGEHPATSSSIHYNQFIIKKEELSDNNWLYIGKESKEKKQSQLAALAFYKNGFIPIFE